MHQERLDLWLEKAIFGLVLTLLVYAPLATGAVRPFDFLVLQWLTLVLVVLWIVRLRVSPGRPWRWPPLCWAVLAFVGYAILRYWTADIEYVARQELIRILVYALVFFVILQNLDKEIYPRIVAITVILLGMGLSFYAAYQFLTGSDRVWGFVRPAVYANRGSGTFICPNHLAGYLELAIPLALALVLVSRLSPLVKIGMGYAAMMMFAGIGMSVSRGGWIATGAMLLVLMIGLLRRKTSRVKAVLLLVAVCVLSLLLIFKVRSSSNSYGKLQWSEQLEDVRFLIWKPTLKMWMDHPLWGVGPDHFDHRYRQYRLPHRDAQTSPRRAHNDYLNTLADWGLAGGLLVAWAWVAFYIRVFRSWSALVFRQAFPAQQGTHAAALVFGASLGLFAMLVHALFDFNMHIPANALTTVAWMAFVSALLPAGPSGSVAPWSSRRRAWVVGVLAAAMMVLGYWTWRKSREVYWTRTAQRHVKCSIEQMRAYARAYEAEPANYLTPLQLGECFRLRSWEGVANYEELAREAITWFERSSRLNPYNPNSVARLGMCLDWIGERGQADAYFERAHQLDPAGYYITALVGWHHMQKEDPAEAKRWFDRSIELHSNNNFIAWFYLQRVKEQLEGK